MYTYKNKTALITGASSGIGASFARALAERGMNVVLVARSEDKLRELAAQLTEQHGRQAQMVVADLSLPGAAQQVFAAISALGLTVDLLVNNAGFSTYGDFETISPAREQAEIAVNVAAVVDFTHAFVPAMLTRGEGAIINVASVGAFVPIARQAVYAATKAFVLSFGEALWVEYRKRGIRVFTLCPGGTETEFANVIEVDVALKLDTPQSVVTRGLKAFERGRHFVVPGPANYFSVVVLPRLMPRGLFARLFAFFARQMLKPRGQGVKVRA